MQPKRKLSRAMVLWPGLPQLWKRGSWAGLVVAVGFTTLVNLLALSTLVYREWFSRQQQLAGLAGVVSLALWAWWQNHRDARREALAAAVATPPAPDELPDPVVARQLDNREQWFSEAQRAYLQGDWVTTEQLLLKLLKQDAEDAPARLMLATLWRKQGRPNEALRQLDKLSRQECGEPWQFEITGERERIETSREEAESAEPEGESVTLVPEGESAALETHGEPVTIKMNDPLPQDAGTNPDTQPATAQYNQANDPTEQRHAA